MVKLNNMLEILEYHEGRIRGMYGIKYSDYHTTDDKKHKRECKKSMDELLIELKLIIKLQNEYKQSEIKNK